jgi:hypothetical protein
LGVLGFVSRRNKLLSAWSEDIEHRFFVVILRCCDECVARVFRCGKGFLAWLLRQGTGGKARQQKDSDRS